MLCELLFIAGAGDRRLKRTSWLHANVTDILRKRGNRFEPVPLLESILKVVCDSDKCGAERHVLWSVHIWALLYIIYECPALTVYRLAMRNMVKSSLWLIVRWTPRQLTCPSSWIWWKKLFTSLRCTINSLTHRCNKCDWKPRHHTKARRWFLPFSIAAMLLHPTNVAVCPILSDLSMSCCNDSDVWTKIGWKSPKRWEKPRKRREVRWKSFYLPLTKRQHPSIWFWNINKKTQ